MKFKRVLLTLLTIATPSVALAHPGHNYGFTGGLLHPLTGVDHLLAMVAVGMLAAHVRETKGVWALPSAFVSALILGGLMGINHIHVSFTETLIALSVLALGVMVALRVTLPVALGIITVAAFGLFHGIAHGLEAGPKPYAFLVGMTITTAILHFSGILFVKKAKGSTGNLIVRMTGSVMALAGILFLIG